MLFTEYASYPECDGVVDTTLFCQGDAQRFILDDSTIEREIDCTNESALGPFDGRVFNEALIELGPSIDGQRYLAVGGEAAERGGVVMIRRCGPCSEGGVDSGIGQGFVPESLLPEGRYLVRLLLPPGSSSGVLSLTISG
ncbi:MAG: hypothetical protein KC457_26780 [Myxococcales bacterium]|nr:hypothetical protein [Myxococcales bacterium]